MSETKLTEEELKVFNGLVNDIKDGVLWLLTERGGEVELGRCYSIALHELCELWPKDETKCCIAIIKSKDSGDLGFTVAYLLDQKDDDVSISDIATLWYKQHEEQQGLRLDEMSEILARIALTYLGQLDEKED